MSLWPYKRHLAVSSGVVKTVFGERPPDRRTTRAGGARSEEAMGCDGRSSTPATEFGDLEAMLVEHSVAFSQLDGLNLDAIEPAWMFRAAWDD
jgi:hypothetical protein